MSFFRPSSQSSSHLPLVTLASFCAIAPPLAICEFSHKAPATFSCT